MKITERLSNRKDAILVGLFLATLWFMPFLSVRNLVEVVAIPFLIYGIWLILNAEIKKNILVQFLYAGLIIGIAFSIRFQTILFVGGVGLALLFQNKWKEAFIFGFGAIFSIVLIQGVVDYFIWKRPFAELTEYIQYNLKYKNAYGTNNPLMYIELVPGMLIPPVGIFLFIGFFMKWKNHLIIFLPTLIFFVFHTLFPNKQERFILTVIPFFVMLGIIGWTDFASKSAYWIKHSKLMKGCYTFFWIINIILLCVVSTTYSKRSRVEAMTYLSQYKKTTNSILVEESIRKNATMVPVYYMGSWPDIYLLGKTDSTMISAPVDTSSKKGIFSRIYSIKYFETISKDKLPSFVLFPDNKDMDRRVQQVKEVFPKLEFEKRIDPSYVDKLMLKLSPSNQNQPIYIYKTNI